jgi:hypothetical protein
MASKSQHEERRAIPRDQVPFLTVVLAAGPLSDTAANFMRWETKADELRRINAELSELKQERPSFDELEERVLASWEKYRTRAALRMARYIEHGATNFDYFSTLEKRATDKYLHLVPRELVVEALEQLKAQGYSGLPEAERKKEIASLQKKQSKIEAEMEQLLPAAQFAKNDPQSNAAINAAAAFFDSWRQLQVYTTDPCCYQGKALHLADAETQKAHAVLGLSALRSRSARLSAYVPAATVA